MRKKLFIQSAVLLCLGWGLTIMARAQESPQAKAELEKARQLDPTYQLTYNLLASVAAASGDQVKAKEYQDRAEKMKVEK